MVIGREWNSCFSRLFDRLVGVGLGVERNAEQMEIAADDVGLQFYKVQSVEM